MDLPEAGSSGPSAAVGSPSGDGGVRPASATSRLEDRRGCNSRSAVIPAVWEADQSFSPRAKYGHDPQYEWLKGKLEYSQIDSHWKLRYIPVDGDTDQYGGSVVLADTSLLGELERGDFVEIRGKLRRRSGQRGYAPEYEATKIKRLGN